MHNVCVDDLKYKSKFYNNFSKYQDGYRVVYFFNNNYSVGEYCKTIEGFMTGFAEYYPIMDDADIPKFISIDDMLNRYLNEVPNAESIGIYKTDGTLVAKKDRN